MGEVLGFILILTICTLPIIITERIYNNNKRGNKNDN